MAAKALCSEITSSNAANGMGLDVTCGESIDPILRSCRVR